jgi:hypothetical protein
MTDKWEAVQRERIIAASGSGGSALYTIPEVPGQLKFGETVFGGPDAPLMDDAGNILTAQACGSADCIGSHLHGERLFCAGPHG